MWPVIFVAGMSRSGSMWTYNVTRRLLEAAGMAALPELIPTDEEALIRHALDTPPPAGGVYCIKTHQILQPIAPEMRIVCNYRDVRDAMYSYMRFMKCPFDRGLKAAEGMMVKTDYYLRQQRPNVMPIRYDEMVGDPRGTIRKIAGFLGLAVTKKDIKTIAENLSRERVNRRLRQLGHVGVDSEGAIAGAAGGGMFAALPNLDGSFRVYDYATGFQSDHIGTARDGHWREVLTEDEQRALMAATSDWLMRYGFPL